ncbi:Chlorophyllase [Rhynchospora pubera]|uniref:Chlorophyllase n=1 Tax=Rhynchospora pubera TaxID=906938 RepID=A0AAV8C4I5_9POAL|nr:Chlorophyllase [Rhynchospora pubera]
MASVKYVFEKGSKSVKMFTVQTKACKKTENSPMKPLLVASPVEEGDYPVVVFLHGYLLYNSFYSQLFNHVASHGFIVIGPQNSSLRLVERVNNFRQEETETSALYVVSGADTTEEIKSAASLLDWLTHNLASTLPPQVRPDLTKLSIAGHSRGGKVAFALALGKVVSSPIKISALIGIDPVDGMDMGNQTPPPILTYEPNSLKLDMPVLVVGSGLGELKRNALFPPAAPKGVSHEQFFNECCAPACYFVAKDYGHVDMLDDETKGFRGNLTYCIAKNGKERKPMRLFVGGIMVAFLKAYLEQEKGTLMAIKDNPGAAPVEVSTCSFLE